MKRFGIWNLRFICNLVLGICDSRQQSQRQSRGTLTPAMRDRHGPSKIPPCGEGPGFLGQSKICYRPCSARLKNLPASMECALEEISNYATTSKRLIPPGTLFIRILVEISSSSRFTWEITPTILPFFFKFLSVETTLYRVSSSR